jgi:hypothetical protein
VTVIVAPPARHWSGSSTRAGPSGTTADVLVGRVVGADRFRRPRNPKIDDSGDVAQIGVPHSGQKAWKRCARLIQSGVNRRRPGLQHECPRQAWDGRAKHRAGQLLAIRAMSDPDSPRIDHGLIGDVSAMTPAVTFECMHFPETRLCSLHMAIVKPPCVWPREAP